MNSFLVVHAAGGDEYRRCAPVLIKGGIVGEALGRGFNVSLGRVRGPRFRLLLLMPASLNRGHIE